AAADSKETACQRPPETTALGALLSHITLGADSETFQPMNVNFGLFPDISAENQRKRRLRGRERKESISRRALDDLKTWLDSEGVI
ncbi:MAG: FADH(2)-oxidizing methylenetetrahydrofolate--tRNA-(uracil(54)-C(5))-methyltransferase TrmFO, partial [Proteobacteria bacterium]|nr:FADH(2)-oxidizing methylenetetrahydrofolate--tRNA-(uracil(54)-C(5))-methyltransferase TrmFO [Pseudomonadota bacterium]